MNSITDLLGKLKEYIPGISSDSLGGFDLDSFAMNFGGGAKAFLFEWTPTLIHPYMKRNDRFLVRSTTVPETIIEEITVEYQQLNYKIGGKKSFSDWIISFNLDNKAELRTRFENWSNNIHKVDSEGFQHLLPVFGESGGPKTFHNSYMTNETFTMLDNNMDPILQITLYGAWPKSIGPITLDYATQDFAQFDVTFSYLYHEIKGQSGV